MLDLVVIVTVLTGRAFRRCSGQVGFAFMKGLRSFSLEQVSYLRSGFLIKRMGLAWLLSLWHTLLALPPSHDAGKRPSPKAALDLVFPSFHNHQPLAVLLLETDPVGVVQDCSRQERQRTTPKLTFSPFCVYVIRRYKITIFNMLTTPGLPTTVFTSFPTIFPHHMVPKQFEPHALVLHWGKWRPWVWVWGFC